MRLIDLENGTMINPEQVSSIRDATNRTLFDFDTANHKRMIEEYEGDPTVEAPKLSDYAATYIKMADGQHFYVRAGTLAVQWVLENGTRMGMAQAFRE